MATAVKRLLVGRALRTQQAIHERLTKKTALAVFSSDALSSTAYAMEVAFGLFHYFTYGGAATVSGPEELKIAEGYKLQPLTLFLLLGAFSNGCAALTGIEAISNGVQAFKKPEATNAATTLTWMALLLTTMFLGTSVMAYLYGVHPRESETVISQFPAHHVHGCVQLVLLCRQLWRGSDRKHERQMGTLGCGCAACGASVTLSRTDAAFTAIH
jgi:hypothetical protein